MVSLVNELFAALDSDPALMEAARARLLSREILELPQTMARLAESQNLALAELADAGTRNAKPGALEVAFAAFRADVISRFVETDSRIAEANAEDERIRKIRRQFEKFRADVSAKFAELNGRLIETNARIYGANDEAARLRREFEDFKDEVNARFDRIETCLEFQPPGWGSLTGWVTKFEFERDFEAYIYSYTDFDLVEVIPFREKREMMRKHGDMLGATDGERRSFVRADALARIVDGEGRDAFLAVEVSYTVHWQDTSRAIRNAGFLTKITGLPAYAAVAGTSVSARSQKRVDSGEILFMEMEDHTIREDEEEEDE